MLNSCNFPVATGNNLENIDCGFNQIFKRFTDPDHVLLFYKALTTTFEQSSYPTPTFVLYILNIKTKDELLIFLRGKTPYLTCFGFELLEEVLNQINDKDAREIFQSYKEYLFEINTNQILPLMEKPALELENFIKVEFQLKYSFCYDTYKAIYDEMFSLISKFLKLRIVGFRGYDSKRRVITCLIPCECVKRAIIVVSSQRDQFSSLGIASVKIGKKLIVQDGIISSDVTSKFTYSTYMHVL